MRALIMAVCPPALQPWRLCALQLLHAPFWLYTLGACCFVWCRGLAVTKRVHLRNWHALDDKFVHDNIVHYTHSTPSAPWMLSTAPITGGCDSYRGNMIGDSPAFEHGTANANGASRSPSRQ